ncbi:hypothetical protein [Vibrio owensii]|uniref:Uncharacterized protein n=1 Tax=Vibrio owensii CAIM 1854 = LMG 25443 TaxID=1229493 RepID=A0A0C1V6Y3_9VIBR|nr:hypothetical protein [Vibrio owensii]KIF45443.1 hypothetical protein H735_29670 [Vibrio owensii CAIM 1854 = LMG 25443]
MLKWRITGHEDSRVIFSEIIPCSLTNQEKIKLLLQLLTAKYCLTNEMLFYSIASEGNRTKFKQDNLLKVDRICYSPKEFSCGENPCFIASLIEDIEE